MAGFVLECDATDQECRALVEKILRSSEFHRTTRLRDFLLYVVDRKLAQSPSDITESLIGHRVFGRPANYNTGEDSIVRTEARLLRQRLDRYFSEEGASEPLLLEIPKGSYVPKFYRRDQGSTVPPAVSVAAPPKPRVRPTSVGLVCACGILTALLAWQLVVSHPRGAVSAPIPVPAAGSVELEASDAQLVKSFDWAKRRALAYVYTGDAVGDWYDSTVDTRNAFCMRDVSHQSTGAAVLGLSRHTRNMLRRFAGSVSASRDWCGFWEINKDGFPAPIDYKDDRNFWYCLPANFDVMRACYRQFLWTGDRSYFDWVFSNFYDRTVTDYVSAWDPDRDGIMQSSPRVRPRGIASYHQEEPKLLIGADMIAAQFTGYLTYAAIQRQKGSRGSLSGQLALEYSAKAQALRERYNSEWWNPVQNRHYSTLLDNHRFSSEYVPLPNLLALLFGLTEDGLKTDAELDCLEKNRPGFDQTLSYYPEVLFQYGRNESAYRYLIELTDPNFRGRGMPEIVFAVVGATATGLAGIAPDSRQNTVETLPRLPKSIDWMKLTHVPVLQNEIAVRHRGLVETTLTNEAGPLIQWRARFPAPADEVHAEVLVDGKPLLAHFETGVNGQRFVSVLVAVRPRETRTIRQKLTVN
jgi:hypothetical protein